MIKCNNDTSLIHKIPNSGMGYKNGPLGNQQSHIIHCKSTHQLFWYVNIDKGDDKVSDWKKYETSLPNKSRLALLILIYFRLGSNY